MSPDSVSDQRLSLRPFRNTYYALLTVQHNEIRHRVSNCHSPSLYHFRNSNRPGSSQGSIMLDEGNSEGPHLPNRDKAAPQEKGGEKSSSPGKSRREGDTDSRTEALARHKGSLRSNCQLQLRRAYPEGMQATCSPNCRHAKPQNMNHPGSPHVTHRGSQEYPRGTPLVSAQGTLRLGMV